MFDPSVQQSELALNRYIILKGLTLIILEKKADFGCLFFIFGLGCKLTSLYVSLRFADRE